MLAQLLTGCSTLAQQTLGSEGCMTKPDLAYEARGGPVGASTSGPPRGLPERREAARVHAHMVPAPRRAPGTC